MLGDAGSSFLYQSETKKLKVEAIRRLFVKRGILTLVAVSFRDPNSIFVLGVNHAKFKKKKK